MNCMTQPKLIAITDDVIIDPSEVTSIQREEVERLVDSGWPSGDTAYERTFVGSVVTLKNGRKIYIPGLTPKQLLEAFGL
jgi:hypothetical protein